MNVYEDLKREEVPRGALTNFLYSKVKVQDIKFYFSDSIKRIVESEREVNVQKVVKTKITISRSGLMVYIRIHASTHLAQKETMRRIWTFVTGFSIKNDWDLFHEIMIYSEAGRFAILYGTKDPEFAYALLVYYDNEPSFVNHRDVEKQKKLARDHFGDMGCITPKMLEAMNITRMIYTMM